MLAVSNPSNATPAIQKKTRKGLALRDITNQTPHPKTLKKTAKKTVNTVKKTVVKDAKKETIKISNEVKANAEAIKETVQEIEYMPKHDMPIPFTNDKYKIDLTSIKPTSTGCVFIPPSFRNFLDDEFEEEKVIFKTTDTDFDSLDPDDSVLYF